MKLTAVVLCLNAAETLGSCLKSLSFCDEVIVADDGSTDASLEIAKQLKSTLVRLVPTDSFAEKRNQVLKEIPEGWVLFVDADEWVGPVLASEIVSHKDSEFDGFVIRRIDTFLGKQLQHGEAGSMWLLRFARVEKGNWGRTVHEVWNVSGKIGRLKGDLSHIPHPTVSSFIDSINRYTSLEVKERTRSGRPSRLLSWFELFIFPGAKFCQNYFWRLGFLDGTRGFIHAYCMSLHSLLVRIKILEYVRAS